MVVFALICFFLGIEIPNHEPIPEEDLTPSMLASLLGLDFGRTGFVLGGHPNGFGVFLGCMALFSIALLMGEELRKKQKWLVIAILSACIFAVLVIDSRGTLGNIVFTLGIILAYKKFRLRWLLPFVFLGIPIIAFSISTVLKAFAQTELASGLSRSGEEDELATGNSRSFIWNECLKEMSEFKEAQIFGYGQQGHLPSGVAKAYGVYLGRLVYTHSFYFQLFFDAGYAGLFLMFGMLFLCLRNGIVLEKVNITSGAIFIVFAICFPFAGIFEAPYGEYNSLCTALCDIIFCFSVFSYNLYLRYKVEEYNSLAGSM